MKKHFFEKLGGEFSFSPFAGKTNYLAMRGFSDSGLFDISRQRDLLDRSIKSPAALFEEMLNQNIMRNSPEISQILCMKNTSETEKNGLNCDTLIHFSKKEDALITMAELNLVSKSGVPVFDDEYKSFFSERRWIQY